LPITIQPYLPEHEPAVAEFSQRLKTATNDPSLVFPRYAVPRWLPPRPGQSVWNEFFLAVEGSAVRGAYGLKQEQLFVREKGTYTAACYHHSLAEGIIDRAYASVGVLLVRDAVARQPLLYVLGMGGPNTPIARMLKALGFSLTALPFYFRVVHPAKFLLEMQALRENRWRALLMNFAAFTGTGWLGIKTIQAAAGLRTVGADLLAEEVDEFSDWTDGLWNDARESVSLAAVRDTKTLRLLYPPSDTLFTRVRVSRDGKAIGWAVVGERRKDSKYGEMRVGSIVDCWASPENAAAVVRAATHAIEKRNVDLIVSNQGHHLWGRAFETTGYLKGPSTFVLAMSPKLTELLQPFEKNRESIHITRADGDGLPRNF